jgi:hypothetical protein
VPKTAEERYFLHSTSGTTGYITTYNYAGGQHLANQDYNNCVRTERGYCSISYTQVSPADFSMSSITAYGTAFAGTGDSCDAVDHIIIVGSASSVTIALTIASTDK